MSTNYLSSTLAAAPNKLCSSPYCTFEGPLFEDYLLQIDSYKPVLVGACWFESFRHPNDPARYVCNRCSHRRLEYIPGRGISGQVWLLCCPFCGEPLGRPDLGYHLFDSDGKALACFEYRPSQADLRAVLVEPRMFSMGSMGMVSDGMTRDELIDLAIGAFQRGEYDRALSLAEDAHKLESIRERSILSRIIIARSLKRLNRLEKAKELFRELLKDPSISNKKPT